MKKNEKMFYEELEKDFQKFIKLNKKVGRETGLDEETLKVSDKIAKEAVRLIVLLKENDVEPKMFLANAPLIISRIIDKEKYIETVASIADALISLGIADGKVEQKKLSNGFEDIYR